MTIYPPIASYDRDEQAIIRQGWTAYTQGLPLAANPYTIGQGDWMLWNDGWLMAQLA